MVLSNRLVLFIGMLTLLLVLSACAGSPEQASQPLANSGEPTPIVVRMLNLDSVLQSTPVPLPTFTPAPTLPLPTDTLAAAALAPEASSSPTAGQSPTPRCRNQAEFVKNLFLGDNARLKANEVFVKIWQIRNSGTCPWTEAYSLILVAGEAMNAPSQIPLPTQVNPGETVDLRVDMVAPEPQGTYESNWLLQDAIGERFGFGVDSSDPLVVRIIVAPPPKDTPS